MKPKYMKPLRYPTNSEKHEYMRMMQAKNRAICKSNVNENWMRDKLSRTGHKWTRQAIWGYRLFDFWCGKLGIAVEVDGPEHKIRYDNYRDEYNYRRSGILVLRVRNQNEEDADAALRVIAESETWQERREKLGLNHASEKVKRRWVSGQQEINL